MTDILLKLLSSTGGAATVIAALAAWLGTVFANRLSKQHEQAMAKAIEEHRHTLTLLSAANQETLRLSTTIDLDLRNHRLAAYKTLWEATSILPQRPKAKNVTYQDIERFSEKLREWYFVQGGMFLSRSAQSDGYVPLQDEICGILSQGVDGVISDTHYDQIRERCSHLRSLLASDIQSRKEGLNDKSKMA